MASRLPIERANTRSAFNCFAGEMQTSAAKVHMAKLHWTLQERANILSASTSILLAAGATGMRSEDLPPISEARKVRVAAVSFVCP
jgi:hypothetical protein